MRILFLALIPLLIGCSTYVTVPKVPFVHGQGPEGAWSEVLQNYVNAEGYIDFETLEKYPHSLEAYITYATHAGPKSTPEAYPTRADEVAYHINTYNAFAMYNVLHSGLPKELFGTWAKARFFFLKKFKIDGTYKSLHAYENEDIFVYEEERLHFALNCMSEGCPRLPQVPFQGAKLEEQLEVEAIEFIRDPRNVRVAPEEESVYLSEIFSFYTADFLKKSPSLIAYVNRYLEEPIPLNYEVKFIPYDWTVIHQRHEP